MEARNLRGVFRDERGFSLVEVLFSTVILFFVSTALLGMAASTTMTALTAKEKNLMVNSVTSYVEEIKGLDFADIGTANPGTGEVVGALSDETTITVDGFNITITPTVTWVNDPNITGTQDYKLLHILVTATPTDGGATVAYETETQVRDVDVGWAWGEYSSNEAPDIEFGFGSPEDGDAAAGSSVLVAADASHPMENGLLATMNFYTDAQPMRDAGGYQAQFTINAQTASQTFYWDTLAQLDDGTPITPDGIRSVKIEVWDNLGQQSYRIRQVVVDNYAPPTPAKPWVEWATDGTVHIAWDPVVDGTDPVGTYFVGIDEDQGAVDWVHTHDRCADLVPDTEYDIPVMNDIYYEPFRRFRVRLYAQSPNYWSPYVISDPMISPPGLSGYYTVTRSTQGSSATVETWNNMYWSAPQFPVGAVEYTVWRGTEPDMSDAEWIWSTNELTETYFEDYIFKTGKKQTTFHDQYYYQLEAWVLPNGPDSAGEGVQVWSNIIGPNGMGNESGDLAVTWP